MTYTFCVHGNNFYNSESKSYFPLVSRRLSGDSMDITDYSASSRYGESNAPTGRSECEPCQCNKSVIENVVHGRQKTASDCVNELPTENNDTDLATIFIITPTHQRDTQKVDLTSMCHTLMNVPRVVWIIIEDAPKPTSLVTNLIQRCKAEIVHLLAYTSAKYRVEKGDHAWSKPRGVEQRNAGLSWLRQHYSPENCNGVVYFGDDDNKYDLRVFDDIRKTKQVSVWKVAWSGGVRWEGPTCHNGYAKSWHAAFAKNRALPVDMAAFSIHLCEFFKHPKAQIGVNINGHSSKQGYLETDLLEHFTNRSAIECRGSENETYVWHSHTRAPNVQSEKREKSSNAIET
jgi:galactosylgalactosylxylosylprotein 3-beta-glucuronosyltransferase 3